jgi:hypothetical protein
MLGFPKSLGNQSGNSGSYDHIRLPARLRCSVPARGDGVVQNFRAFEGHMYMLSSRRLLNASCQAALDVSRQPSCAQLISSTF